MEYVERFIVQGRMHFDGSSWTPSATGTTLDLASVFPLSPTDVWAAGAHRYATPPSYVFLHYDGTKWSEIPKTQGVRAVWGTDLDHLWATGEDSMVLRYRK